MLLRSLCDISLEVKYTLFFYFTAPSGLTVPQLIGIIVAVVLAATIAIILTVIVVCVTCRRHKYKEPTLDSR